MKKEYFLSLFLMFCVNVLLANDCENPPVAQADISIIECEQDSIQTLDANDAIDWRAVPAGYIVQWYTVEIGGVQITDPTLNTVGSISYYAEFTDVITGCKSLTRTRVELEIHSAPSIANITVQDTLTGVEGDTLNANDALSNVPAGNTVVWFDENLTLTQIFQQPLLSEIGKEVFYAELENPITGCRSYQRIRVTLEITANENLSIGNGDLEEVSFEESLVVNTFVTENTIKVTVLNTAIIGAEFQLFHISGNLVQTGQLLQSENTLFVGDVSAGIYFLKIHSKSGAKTFKIVK